jgi:hypothetical protein
MEHETKEYWRLKLGIEVGMSKDEALEKFRVWREKMKTCERCEGEKYVEFCPIHLICKEADNVGRNDNGNRTNEVNEPQAPRACIFENRERVAIRQSLKDKKSLS